MLDKEMREPLFDYLDERYGKVRTIEEKVILRSRADVLAIIDGRIIGMEIKSDNDTYARLSRQIKDYESFCDLCYVVVGESHIHVEKHIPDHWGIIVITSDNVIVDRDALLSPKVDIYNQLDILWRNELSNIQEKEGLPKLRGTKRRLIYQRLIDKCGIEQIKRDITDELFERDYTIYDDQITAGKRYVTKSTGVKRKSRSRKKMAHVRNYIGPKKKPT